MKWAMWALPLLVLAACDARKEGQGESMRPADPSTSGDRAKDPICNMMVDKAGPHKATHEGATYHFCAEECLKKFKAEPAKHAVACSCGKTAKKCPCGHCGTHGDTCDCG